jgi:hypothetical protein
MNFAGVVLAFHGCDKAVAERILSGVEHVRPSMNRHDWLGSGAYFWENSPARALSWAEFLRDHPRYATSRVVTPFVVGAIIVPGRCLDLTESRSLAILRDAYREYAASMEEAEAPLPQNERGRFGDEDFVKRYLDYAVIDFLHQMRQDQNLPPFDTLRGAFFEGGPLYPGAGIADKTHIQWCVRNPKYSVRGYFRVSAEWEE